MQGDTIASAWTCRARIHLERHQLHEGGLGHVYYDVPVADTTFNAAAVFLLGGN
jgi:hypothetical protein